MITRVYALLYPVPVWSPLGLMALLLKLSGFKGDKNNTKIPPTIQRFRPLKKSFFFFRKVHQESKIHMLLLHVRIIFYTHCVLNDNTDTIIESIHISSVAPFLQFFSVFYKNGQNLGEAP